MIIKASCERCGANFEAFVEDVSKGKLGFFGICNRCEGDQHEN